jgi:Flp pilus assembly protein TadB
VGFHLSDRRQYCEKPKSNFANNYRGPDWLSAPLVVVVVVVVVAAVVVVMMIIIIIIIIILGTCSIVRNFLNSK